MLAASMPPANTPVESEMNVNIALSLAPAVTKKDPSAAGKEPKAEAQAW